MYVSLLDPSLGRRNVMKRIHPEGVTGGIGTSDPNPKHLVDSCL